jgi:hypothetical protein
MMSSCQRRGGTGDGVRWITVEPHPHMPAPCLPADLPQVTRLRNGRQAVDLNLGAAMEPLLRLASTNLAEPVGAVSESWMTVSVAESSLVQAMLHHVGLVCACGELRVRALAPGPWQGVVQAFKVRAVIVVELLWAPVQVCRATVGVDAMPTSCLHLFERLHHRHPIVSPAAACTDAHPAAQSTPASSP